MPYAPRSGRHLDNAELNARKQRSRRATFVKWLRKVHGWVGLWGAVLGLLFGPTGFLLNHRAGPLKVSTGKPQVSQMQMAVPAHGLKSPMELGKWLKQELKLDGNIGRPKREAAHPVGRSENDAAGVVDSGGGVARRIGSGGVLGGERVRIGETHRQQFSRDHGQFA